VVLGNACLSSLQLFVPWIYLTVVEYSGTSCQWLPAASFVRDVTILLQVLLVRICNLALLEGS